MHYPYKELLEELKHSQKMNIEKELRDLTSSCVKAGRSPSGVFFEQFINIYDSYISKNFCEMFEQEKKLLCNQKTAEDHFGKFEKNLLEINGNEYDELRCELYNRLKPMIECGKINSNEVGIYLEKVEGKKNMMIKSIKRRINLLQEDSRRGILQDARTTFQIGGDVGVINTGTVYGSIQTKLEQLKDSKKELVEAFAKLTEAIKRLDINDGEKREKYENVAFLVNQCETPKEKRNLGVIKSVFNALSATANIATIWGEVANIIKNNLS